MEHLYSKPSGDVRKESLSIIKQEQSLQRTITEITALLVNYPVRDNCLLCRCALAGSEIFLHRGTPFYECRHCHHIQTQNNPDSTYEKAVSQALGYEGVYPALNIENYKKRCERIYRPKADWIFETLRKDDKDPCRLTWCDIGCGTGSFLYALQEMGCQNLYGIDRDEHNLKIAQDVLGNSIVSRHAGSFAQALHSHSADIYSAFFVLEHVTEAADAIEALKALPSGTYLAFSVPTFGFITLFESILRDHYPRNLDAMMHTQIYTEDSLRYFLNQAGFTPVSEWIFGQDTIDIHRFLSVNLKDIYPSSLYNRVQEKLNPLIDPLQAVIDRGHFSDARHILAVRQ